MLSSAQIPTAGETNRSRWDQARVRLLIPIGVIVVIAIICIAVGVLSSAQRANRISVDSERQSILRSIDENAERMLRHLQSVASMPEAAAAIRDRYDAAWVDRRVGEWLETFYNADIVAVFDADDQMKYFRSRMSDEAAPADLAAELNPTLEVLRGRLTGQASRMVLVTPRDLSKPSSVVAAIQIFRGQPAIVAAVAIGPQANTAIANDGAPIVASIKYLNERLLARIAARL